MYPPRDRTDGPSVLASSDKATWAQWAATPRARDCHKARALGTWPPARARKVLPYSAPHGLRRACTKVDDDSESKEPDDLESNEETDQVDGKTDAIRSLRTDIDEIKGMLKTMMSNGTK